MKNEKEYHLTKIINEASTESVMRIIDGIFKGETKLRLNWSETEEVGPSGISLLTLLFDYASERGVKIDSVFTARHLKLIPIVARLQNVREKSLIEAKELSYENQEGQYYCLENEHPKTLSERQRDPFIQADIQLLFRELTQNAIEHSSSERFYSYYAESDGQIHLGVLDLGVSIPAKLKNHFNLDDDLSYIEAALERGNTSRRLKEGGEGLYRVSQMVKRLQGRMAILSGEGQLRRYYAHRRIDRKLMKYRTPGTWIFITLPMTAK